MPKTTKQNKNPGERLKVIRAMVNLNQTEFAERLGIQQGSYSGVEKGRYKISKQVEKALEREFNVNIEWVLTGVGEPFLEFISDIKERVKEIMGFFNLTTNELADRIGLDELQRKVFIKKIEEKDHKLTDGDIKLILHAFPEISEDWLRTGKGYMLSSDVQSSKRLFEHLRSIVEKLEQKMKDLEQANYYLVKEAKQHADRILMYERLLKEKEEKYKLLEEKLKSEKIK